jgi:hypothetical protein
MQKQQSTWHLLKLRASAPIGMFLHMSPAVEHQGGL